MREGRADVIDTAFYTPERDLYMDFSNPYAEIEVPVFFDKSLSGIGGVRDLRGFVVGVKDGDACIDILEKHGVSSLKKYPSYESIVHAAGEGEIHVFCIDKPPAVYYLYRAGLETVNTDIILPHFTGITLPVFPTIAIQNYLIQP